MRIIWETRNFRVKISCAIFFAVSPPKEKEKKGREEKSKDKEHEMALQTLANTHLGEREEGRERTVVCPYLL